MSKIFTVSAVALMLVCKAGRAQDAATADAKGANSPGLLGRTYLELDGGAIRVRNDIAKPTGLVAGANVNLPIDDGFDYRLGCGFQDATNSLLKLRDMHVDNAVTYYYRTRVLSPYLAGGFGYDWAKDTVNHVKERNNHVFYEVGTGVEVPVTKATAIRLGVNYDQALKKPRARELGYAVTGNYWFNDTVGASLGATLRQGRNGAHDALLYVAGVHFSFD